MRFAGRKYADPRSAHGDGGPLCDDSADRNISAVGDRCSNRDIGAVGDTGAVGNTKTASARRPGHFREHDQFQLRF